MSFKEKKGDRKTINKERKRPYSSVYNRDLLNTHTHIYIIKTKNNILQKCTKMYSMPQYNICMLIVLLSFIKSILTYQGNLFIAMFFILLFFPITFVIYLFSHMGLVHLTSKY